MKLKKKVKLALVKKPVLHLVPKAVDIPDVIYGLLQRYERCELEIARIKNDNEALFNELEALEAEEEEVKGSIRRLAYSKEGPPPGAIGKFFAPAQTQMFRCEITYPRQAPYYDPAKLPKELLVMDGIVTSVDKDAIISFMEENPKYIPIIGPAIVEGNWATPRVSIKRL
jgi:hypothetical protein